MTMLRILEKDTSSCDFLSFLSIIQFFLLVAYSSSLIFLSFFFSFLGHYPCHLHVSMSPLTQTSLLFFLTPFPAPDHLQSQFPAVSFLNRSSVSLYGSGRVDGVMNHTKREQKWQDRWRARFFSVSSLQLNPFLVF